MPQLQRKQLNIAIYLLKSVILHLFTKAIEEFNDSELADSDGTKSIPKLCSQTQPPVKKLQKHQQNLQLIGNGDIFTREHLNKGTHSVLSSFAFQNPCY